MSEVAVELAKREADVRVALPARVASPAAVQVAEPSRRVTLEDLRRNIQAGEGD